MAGVGTPVGKMLVRNYSTPIDTLRMIETSRDQLGRTLKLWKGLSILGFGIVLIGSAYNYLQHKEHEKHFKTPPFVKYSYLAKRTKKFPWGDGNHSLFHNPKHNALPDGYEVIVE